MLLDLLTSSQTQGVVGAAVASMSMMSSMGPMPMTMASGAPPGIMSITNLHRPHILTTAI